MKEPKELLEVLLWKMFIKAFKNAELCAGDSVRWYNLSDKEEMKEYFEKWLKREGYSN